jgi:hypothetical protein
VGKPVKDPELRKSLVQLLVKVSADSSSLDAQDEDILVQYGLGVITRDEVNRFFQAKAARIEAQFRSPQ